MISYNNLQLMGLKLCIKNIVRCIGIVDFYLQGDNITSETLSSSVKYFYK